MRARTVAGADGRTWSVRRNIEWKTPATGAEFEHDVDGGRGAVLLILSALFLFWVVLILWTPPLVHIPWYLWVIALAILAVLPDPLDRCAARGRSSPRPAAATTCPPSTGRGWSAARSRAKEEMRVLVRSLRTRATPGHADSPLHPVN